MAQWQRTEPVVGSAGDVGGDIQASDAYDARWVRRRPDGSTAMVTRAYYVVADEQDTTSIECQTEYLICSDPSEPGGTELWADYRYRTLPTDTSQSSADDAWIAALGAVEPTDDEWSSIATSYDDDTDGM